MSASTACRCDLDGCGVTALVERGRTHPRGWVRIYDDLRGGSEDFCCRGHAALALNGAVREPVRGDAAPNFDDMRTALARSRDNM